jgi:H+/gluconate symporter-like permease
MRPIILLVIGYFIANIIIVFLGWELLEYIGVLHLALKQIVIVTLVTSVGAVFSQIILNRYSQEKDKTPPSDW